MKRDANSWARPCAYLFVGLLLPGAAAATASDVAGRKAANVSIGDFEHLVSDGDWSPAIQGAIDSVSIGNGYTAGATITISPGTYKLDGTIVLGRDQAHWGVRLLGYGATLVGSIKLDEQPLAEPEPEEKDLGVPILSLMNPPEIEGAGYVIEGLTFRREGSRTGIGIQVPFKQVPKHTTFRNLKIFQQNVGIHLNYAWQFSIVDCMFRANNIGMIVQNHGNNIGIVNCNFRRNHYHGLIIGPDRGSWGSNSHHISGTIFESNKGFGLLLHTSGQSKISGNYFEANGNSIGVNTPYASTTIDTNFFWGKYGDQWHRNDFSDNFHIVLTQLKRVQLRNNHYREMECWVRRKTGEQRWEYVARKGDEKPEQEEGYDYEERSGGILITGELKDEGNVFDAVPIVHQNARVERKIVGADDGLHYYEYNAVTNTFSRKSLLER